ncbi:T9SS type A sorting domain-containing protein [Bacteroidota bacterium]
MKKNYLLLTLVFLSSILSGQTEWIKYAENPIMEPGIEGEWDEGYLHGGSVIFHDDTFRMWYSKGLMAPTEPYIGYATSLDGIHWTKYDDNPVLLTGPGGSWDEGRIIFPTVLIRDMVFHMWYIGQPAGSDYLGDKIGHATSTDGIHWEKDPQNPIMDKGSAGSLDAGAILLVHAVHDDSLYHFWYGANNGVDDLWSISHATSQDGTTWSRDPENPVLTGDSWDIPICYPGPVLYKDSAFQMWYPGGDGTTWNVGYATSVDGTDWVKPSESPVLTCGQPGEWDEGHVAAKGILYDSTLRKYKMWYSSRSKGVGYAESEIPVTGVSLEEHTLYLEIGDTADLVATVSPPDATDLFVNWWSVNEDIAEVNDSGEVIARSVDSTYIIVTTTDGGFKDSCKVIVTPTNNVMQSQVKYTISIYPNPVIDLLNVQTGLSEDQFIEIASLNGQVVYSMTMDRPDYQIDLSLLEKGVYFITFRSMDFMTTKKVIKM